ncbi:MAG: thioredoxin [Acidimicrobiia bacterium]|nr:thioredoxin [Acidimicrobiia bacterium]NND14339.1 thioredoxin [Acidimicrobiia bacterium]NNL47311.1 thioredoxin [Acidimicrobiia bacterium]
MKSSNIVDVNASDFPREVLQASHERPVVVDFWAEWCGPCKTLGPILERLAVEYDGAFRLVKIDVDANQALAQQFGVQGIPFVMAFSGGQPVAEFTGAIPESQVRAWLDPLLPNELDDLVEQGRDALLDGDDPRAEEAFRAVLAQQSDHQEAGTSLAQMLIAAGKIDEALDVLAPMSATTEVERLRAAARLSENRDQDVSSLAKELEGNPQDDAKRVELAQALAGRAEYEPALDHLLKVVRGGGPERENARQAMIDIFGVLGVEHPLVLTYRRQLASALF